MNKIKDLKEYRGLTNGNISYILEANHDYRYSKSTISRWINGDKKCPEEVITVLAGPDLFDVDNEYLGELFDEVYSEKHYNPLDQMCINDEDLTISSSTIHQYISYSRLCEMFEGELPWSDLKLLLNGFSNKADERGFADALTLNNDDWDCILQPLWDSGVYHSQSSYHKVLLKLYDLGLYKLEKNK